MADGLPIGWQLATIGDVTLPVQKIDPSKNPTQEIIYLDISGIDNKLNKIVEVKNYLGKDAPSRARQLVEVGDVLFSTVRTYLKNIAVVPSQYDGQVASTGFSVLRATNGISGNFLFHFSRTTGFLDQLADLQRGSSYPAVRDIDVRVQQIPIPPTNEQKRIVDKIEQLFSNLDEGESLLKKVQQQLNLYRQSVLKAAVTGELTKDWREANKHRLESGDALLKRILKARREQLNRRGQYKEPVPPDSSSLPKLPGRWIWCALDQIISDGPQNGVYYPKNLYGKGIKILRIDDYQIGWIRNCDQLQKVDSPEKDRNTYRLKSGDIVVNRVNSVSHLGKSVCISKSHEGCIFESNMMKFTLTCDVNNKFIELYLGSSIGRARLIINCKHAVNQASINQEDVKQTPVPLAPLLEQDEIVNKIDDIFSQIDALEDWCASELTRSATLRQSILKNAFTGKLVPQDPNDEPASELLKRIQAEKTGVQKAPKGKSPSTTPTRRGRPRKNKLS